MLTHNSPPIVVDCGLEGDAPRKQDHLFYAVMRPKFCEVFWQPASHIFFALVFTSKQAVFAFKQNIFPKITLHNSWQHCVALAAVGTTTAQSIKQELAPLLAHTKNPVLLPTLGNGLAPLLFHMHTKLNSDVQFCIFTSAIGKTTETITTFCKQHDRNINAVPVYTLENVSESNTTQFLTTLFAPLQSTQQQVLFYCRSGLILKHVVHNLLQFFNLQYPTQLPSFIYFFPWEQSAQQALCELNLIDRTTS